MAKKRIHNLSQLEIQTVEDFISDYRRRNDQFPPISLVAQAVRINIPTLDHHLAKIPLLGHCTEEPIGPAPPTYLPIHYSILAVLAACLQSDDPWLIREGDGFCNETSEYRWPERLIQPILNSNLLDFSSEGRYLVSDEGRLMVRKCNGLLNIGREDSDDQKVA